MLPTVNGEFGVVQDPELRFNDNGKAWMKIRGKANARTRDKDGNWVDGEICFIDIIVSQKLAENTMESITKGSTITVIGSLHYREWENNEGSKQKTYSIWADSLGVTPRFTPVKASNLPSMPKVTIQSSEEAPF